MDLDERFRDLFLVQRTYLIEIHAGKQINNVNRNKVDQTKLKRMFIDTIYITQDWSVLVWLLWGRVLVTNEKRHTK